jgi:tetratricopeptide (TPR) repeat protein
VEHLRDSGLSGRYYFWLAHTWSYLGNQDQAGEAARRALAEGERSGDEATMGKAYYVLARRGFWSCRFPEGVDHGRRAIELLERTEEWLWLGQAHWAVGVNHHFMGEFDRALEAMTRAYAIGDATGNPRLLTYTEWARGWTLATRGDWQAGLEACQRSLEGSRDAVNTACALGWSGFAHLEKGDPAAAIPLLEQAIEGFARIGYESILGWFKSWLADALRLGGKHSRVRQVATEALEIGTKFANPYSIGLVRRVLGRIALSDGELPAAEACLADALETFTAIQSRFEVAVTRLDLAALVMARGDPAGASGQLAEAHATFTALAAPKLAERAERLAGELGVPLHGGRA